MFPQSIRYRLPLTYAAIALLTAAALGAILLVSLRLLYQQQESAYMFAIGGPISEALGTQLAAGAEPEAVRGEAERLGSAYQVRVRVWNADGEALVDTGLPGPFLPLRLEALDLRTPAAVPTLAPQATTTTTAGATAAPALEALPAATALPALRSRPASPEAIYGFDAARRSPEVVELRLVDPGTGQALGRLTLSDGPAYGGAIVERVAQVSAAAGLAAVLLAAAAGWWVSRRITLPLTALTEVTQDMAQGQLSARAPVARLDEIGLLAHSFNEMAGRVERTVGALRNFIGDSAHELHTPLTALRTNLDLALDAGEAAAQQAYVARAQAQAGRLQALADDLLDLSRLDAGAGGAALARFDLAALARELGEVYASRAEQAGLDFHLDVPGTPALMRGDPDQVRRALGNVLDNAIKFTPAGGRVGLGVHAEGHWLAAAVTDTGIGIPPGDVPEVFNRFHRGHNTADYAGSGLGLAIVKAIMDRHGGEIDLASGGEGTRVVLRWPAEGVGRGA